MKENNFIKKFNPVWFATVLGFGGIALTSILTANIFKVLWLKPIAIFLVYFNFLLFLFLFTIWLLKLILYSDTLMSELKHTTVAGFHSLMPAAMVMVSINFSKIGKMFPLWQYQNISILFWVVGAVFEFILLTLAVYFLIINEDMKIDFMNGGWLVPPVAALLTSIAGAGIINFISGVSLSESVLWINYFFFGMGLFIFLLIAVALFSKLFFFEKLNPKIFPSLWIIMVPFSLATLSFTSLAKETSIYLPQFKNALMGFGLFINPMLIGIGLWLLIILCALTHHYIRKIELPYGEGWWAFVFPTASVSLASLNYTILAKQIFFAYCGLIVYIVLIVIATIVLFRTIKYFLAKS
ncbi:MAG TPA: hypothetical protein ENL06_03130 [Candidatus Portnoybacteria bacterium]|nr:hypothetical protein [Candidatus Portnoybacteria bacterium]